MIEIYTKGICVPNPGKMGIGVVMIYRENGKELSEQIDEGTNNLAEFLAVQIALNALKSKSIEIVLFSNNDYVVNAINEKWSARLHSSLVAKIKALISTFDNLSIQRLSKKDGNEHNARVRQLAVNALAE